MGGDLCNVPKPWKFYFFDANPRPREIKIKSHVYGVYGYSLGGNGHHHCDIDEEDNMVWDISLLDDPFTSNKNDLWRQPWRWPSDKNMKNHELVELHKTLVQGRRESNNDFVTKKKVIKWAVGILKEWGVLKNPNYKVTWDLDDDDPSANEERGRLMRKRAMDRD